MSDPFLGEIRIVGFPFAPRGYAQCQGQRMPIAWTRALLNGALTGELDKGQFRRDPYFGFSVPVAAPGIPAESLVPEATWSDKAAYKKQAERLVDMFRENFKRFASDVDGAILSAGPVAATK